MCLSFLLPFRADDQKKMQKLFLIDHPLKPPLAGSRSISEYDFHLSEKAKTGKTVWLWFQESKKRISRTHIIQKWVKFVFRKFVMKATWILTLFK